MQQSNLEREDWNELEDGFGSTPQIPEIRVEFVRLLTSGKCPQLEVFLEKVEPERRAALLGSLLPLEMAQNRQDGQEVSLEEYSRRFPKYLKIVEAAFRPKSTRVGGETEVDSADSSVIGARQKETIPQPTKADFPKEDLDDFYLVGKGQQGAVYSAWYETLGNRRAIKIPFMRAKQTNEDLEAQLTREFKLLNRLRDKGARVPHAYSKGRMRDGKPYLELEYLRIGSLQKLLEERDATRARPWQYWVAMMIDLAETLAVIHAEQIYHFDIKPDNILIDETGRPVLCDFAASADHDEFHNGCSIGVTKGYTAPELQRLKENPDASRQGDGRSDIYSLGRVFYELLSDKQLPAQTEGRGRETLGIWQTPVSRGTGIVSKGLGTIGKLFDSQRKPTPLVPLQPLRQVVPDLPKSIADLIAEMLAEFGQRIESATEVAQRLKAALRRDANPPMKRVKTAAVWGGWVATLVLSFWMGTQLYSALWNLRAHPKPRVVVSDPASPPALFAIPGERGVLEPQLFVHTGGPILIRYDQVGTRRILDIHFSIRQPPIGGFGVFHDLVLNPDPEGLFAAEFELVYFEMPVFPLHPEMPPCGNESFLMTVSFERFRIRKDPWRLEAVPGANVFDQRVCFSKDKDVHDITIRFCEKTGEFLSVGVDDNWTKFPTPIPLGNGVANVRRRPPLQKEFGLLLRVGDLVLSPEISVREKP
jgi:serine/threonine protein kinase